MSRVIGLDSETFATKWAASACTMFFLFLEMPISMNRIMEKNKLTNTTSPKNFIFNYTKKKRTTSSHYQKNLLSNIRR